MEYRAVQITAFLLKTLLKNCILAYKQETSSSLRRAQGVWIGQVKTTLHKSIFTFGLSVKEACVFDIVLRYDVER